MLVDSPYPEMRIHWTTAIALALPFSLITVLLLSLAVRARRNKVETGSEGMIGETGTAVTALAPEGKVFVHGEYWNAVSPGARGCRRARPGQSHRRTDADRRTSYRRMK